MKKLVAKYQTHKHTFSCQKKNRLITIKETEGHGKNDNLRKGPKISNYVQCKYNFPQFPMNRTRFILGMRKDLEAEEINQCKKDLQKIKKYLIRQTYMEDLDSNNDAASNSSQLCATNFSNLTFIEFLYEVGMFESKKPLEDYSRNEKSLAFKRYIKALSAFIRGSGSIFLKRETKDILTNNFNRKLMGVHQANHDLQIVLDQVILMMM